MKLNKIVMAASKHYSDSLIEQAWDSKKSRPNDRHVGDSLASFIAQELYETYDSSLESTAQLSEAVRCLNRAKRDIDTAIDGLMELYK